ncbi:MULTISPECIES: WD40 repeat domain-containing protein [unclassified Microcoleus]|uniref:WD40 repeat domain-containing protein n=1 Tax=unclassified Microcoleus TaxID=2642155 RepID=UPI002FD688AE
MRPHDGTQIVSGSYDKTVRLWGDISLEGLLHRACDQLRYHSVLVEPETDLAREAKKTCQRYKDP